MPNFGSERSQFSRHGKDGRGATLCRAWLLCTVPGLPRRHALRHRLLCLVGGATIYGGVLVTTFRFRFIDCNSLSSNEKHWVWVHVASHVFSLGGTSIIILWCFRVLKLPQPTCLAVPQVKLIPPGLHYVYCSASAAEDIGICRSGFFLHMKPKDVAVFRWDPENEELIRPENEECIRYADGVRSFDFDRNLGPYPLELREQWAELTRHTTADLVQKIEPISGRVRSKRAEYDAATNPKAAEDCPPIAFQLGKTLPALGLSLPFCLLEVFASIDMIITQYIRVWYTSSACRSSWFSMAFPFFYDLPKHSMEGVFQGKHTCDMSRVVCVFFPPMCGG